ncbi:hypothetical protein RchiOBHm_Chr1g0340741 [Rosa chinensis]|uniref:Uncharacterized protein n=1 Tax=Rosa chinensis TaxID=74649 RepID=A0A2P6SDJ6_ROSCH|nr:hypothetical protein RchiOBHm_Chr1g0340741 [Rosa chinensis]
MEKPQTKNPNPKLKNSQNFCRRNLPVVAPPPFPPRPPLVLVCLIWNNWWL